MIGEARATFWAVAAVLGLLVSGAAGRAQEEPAKPAEKPPISETEALEFDKELVDGLLKLDGEAVTRAVDFDAILDAAIEGVEVPAGFREGFLKGAQGARERDGHPLLVEFRPWIRAGAEIKAVKGLRWTDRPACLVRIIGSDMVVSYIVFLLERGDDGHIKAVDYYSLASGELASQAIRRVYMAAVAQANQGFLGRLFGGEQAFLKHLDALKRMAAAHREGRAKEALEIYDELPEASKNEKVFQILRYSSAQKLGDEKKYLEAIEDFARRFPDDPARDFLMIDGYLVKDPPEPAKALECIDRLNKTLGGDAYLKVLRGNMLMRLDRFDDALTSYFEAVADEPNLRQSYSALLEAALVMKRFDVVADMLDALESILDQELVDLSEIPDFKEFLASPEGKAWTEKRAKPQEDEAPGP